MIRLLHVQAVACPGCFQVLPLVVPHEPAKDPQAGFHAVLALGNSDSGGPLGRAVPHARSRIPRAGRCPHQGLLLSWQRAEALRGGLTHTTALSAFAGTELTSARGAVASVHGRGHVYSTTSRAMTFWA